MQALGHPMADKRLEILRSIHLSGSISEAARQVGVSYKAAWQAIDTLSNLAGVALLARSVGGAGGGGAKLTPAALELLAAAEAMQQVREQTLQQLQARQYSGVAARLAIQTSMRNQWPCQVAQLEAAGPLMRVHLVGQEAGALSLVAKITTESAELLGLRPGMPVLAMSKATAVTVALTAPDDASNTWRAKAVRVARGQLGDEIAAQLDAGVQMVGFAPGLSGLRAGRRVWLSLPEAAVVLAVVPV